MNSAERLAGAWNGDRARKQASIDAARAALAVAPAVVCFPTLLLAGAGNSKDWSNVYCAAYGTSDAAELEARAGLPSSILMLASAALYACDHNARTGDDAGGSPRTTQKAVAGAIAALEAIPVGAHPDAIARSYVVRLLGELAAFRDGDGRALVPDRVALLRRIATLHEGGSEDPVAFRALRRVVTAASDAATGELDAAVLEFAASVAWPIPGLTAELAPVVVRVHEVLCSYLAPARPSPEEQALLDAVAAHYASVAERRGAGVALDLDAEQRRIKATPEYVATREPAFQRRLAHYERVAAEAYAPFAIELLLAAFGNPR